MKKVNLKKMTLINFKGQKDLEIKFSNHTIISGQNRVGKSTIFDAFIWVLFGKDQFDRKDFEIIPIVDGKRQDRVDSEVKILIDYDGREMELKRVLHQKWVRRRGASEEVFDGCETLFYINDVPKKAGEYKSSVDLIIEESIFKLITNTAAFLSLHWTKQREFLFQIAGTISDAEVAGSDPRFAQLLEMVNGKSLVEFKKEISARKKKLKADLDDIQPKIDQTVRLMPEAIDFESVEAAIADTDKAIAEIDLQMNDRAAAIRVQYDEIQNSQDKINVLKNKQRDVVNAATLKAQQEAFDANQKSSNYKNEIKQLEINVRKAAEMRDITAEMLEDNKANKASKEAEIVKLREKWSVENEKEYVAKTGCLICPVFGNECSDKEASARHAEVQEIAKQKFIEAKRAVLDEINKQGSLLKLDIDNCDEKIAEFEAKLKTETETFETAEQKLKDAKAMHVEFDPIQPKLVNANEIPEWQELDCQIKSIESTIEDVKVVDNSDLLPRKAQLNETRDNLKKALSARDLIYNYKSEIKRLEAQSSDISQQIADLEGKEFTIDAFNRVKIDECELRINSKFKIVKFQLFDKTNEGNEFECCVPLNKYGIPIAATNTAERINAGLDIINTLSEFYNVSAPIFIDNSEAVNQFISGSGQMINLVVTNEKNITIS